MIKCGQQGVVLGDLFSKLFSLPMRVGISSAFIIALIAGAVIYRSIPHAPPTEIEHIYWGKSLVATNDPAKALGKYVLADVYTDWCSWCKKLDHEVFTDQALVKYLNKEFICVKLNATDADEGSTVASSFGVHSYPCALVFSPDGELIGEVNGFMDASAYMARLEQMVQANKNPTTATGPEAQPQPQPETASQPQPQQQPQAESQPQSQPQPQAQPQTQSQQQTQAQPQPQPPAQPAPAPSSSNSVWN